MIYNLFNEKRMTKQTNKPKQKEVALKLEMKTCYTLRTQSPPVSSVTIKKKL